MELQLHRCVEWSHDALQVAPWRKSRERAQRILPRAHTAEESFRLSVVENESGNGIKSKVLPADRWKGLDRNFVAAPRYSSLLKLTRRRSQELKMETRDRVVLSTSDWVFQRVKDPLVEIDPVTVNEAILAEEQADGVAVATTTSPSFFGYLPPGFPKGADRAAIAAGILLLLAALITAAILALRGKKSAVSVTHVAPGGQEANGSVTNGGARQDLEDDRTAAWQDSSSSSGESDQAVRKRQVPAVTSSLETQTTPYKPIPQYSTALDQSDLPLPPSLGTSTKDKEIDFTSSSSDDDHVVSFENLPNVEKAETSGHEAPHVEEANESIDEEIISTNGVMKGDSTLEEVASELQSAAIVEIAASALQEELAMGTTGNQVEELVELGPVEDSLTAEEYVVAGGLPSASESVEEQLSDVSVGEEYILIGESDSLSPVGDFLAPAKPTAALPVTVDVGVPVDSILVDKSTAQPSSEKLSSGKIDLVSAAAQEKAGSVPVQAGSGAEVAEERRKEYTQVIEKVLPAVSVGAGVAALSSFSGVDGALQVVGALATASFLREVIWAGSRQQLFDEIRNIKSHKQLLQFLADKKIFPESWSH